LLQSGSSAVGRIGVTDVPLASPDTSVADALAAGQCTPSMVAFCRAWQLSFDSRAGTMLDFSQMVDVRPSSQSTSNLGAISVWVNAGTRSHLFASVQKPDASQASYATFDAVSLAAASIQDPSISSAHLNLTGSLVSASALDSSIAGQQRGFSVSHPLRVPLSTRPSPLSIQDVVASVQSASHISVMLPNGLPSDGGSDLVGISVDVIDASSSGSVETATIRIEHAQAMLPAAGWFTIAFPCTISARAASERSISHAAICGTSSPVSANATASELALALQTISGAGLPRVTRTDYNAGEFGSHGLAMTDGGIEWELSFEDSRLDAGNMELNTGFIRRGLLALDANGNGNSQNGEMPGQSSIRLMSAPAGRVEMHSKGAARAAESDLLAGPLPLCSGYFDGSFQGSCINSAIARQAIVVDSIAPRAASGTLIVRIGANTSVPVSALANAASMRSALLPLLPAGTSIVVQADDFSIDTTDPRTSVSVARQGTIWHITFSGEGIEAIPSLQIDDSSIEGNDARAMAYSAADIETSALSGPVQGTYRIWLGSERSRPLPALDASSAEVQAALEALPSVGRVHVLDEMSRRTMPGHAWAVAGSSRVQTSLDPRPILTSYLRGNLNSGNDGPFVWIGGRGPFRVLQGSVRPNEFQLADPANGTVPIAFNESSGGLIADDEIDPAWTSTQWELDAGGSRWKIAFLSSAHRPADLRTLEAIPVQASELSASASGSMLADGDGMIDGDSAADSLAIVAGGGPMRGLGARIVT